MSSFLYFSTFCRAFFPFVKKWPRRDAAWRRKGALLPLNRHPRMPVNRQKSLNRHPRMPVSRQVSPNRHPLDAGEPILKSLNTEIFEIQSLVRSNNTFSVLDRYLFADVTGTNHQNILSLLFSYTVYFKYMKFRTFFITRFSTLNSFPYPYS